MPLRKRIEEEIRRHKKRLAKGQNIDVDRDAVHSYEYLLRELDRNRNKVKKALHQLILAQTYCSFSVNSTFRMSDIIKQVFPEMRVPIQIEADVQF